MLPEFVSASAAVLNLIQEFNVAVMIPCNPQDVTMMELWSKQTELGRQCNVKTELPAEMTRFYFDNHTVETL